METVESIIVGGGQAGLSTSYHLTQNNHEHLVLEKASQPASPWRNERWDSFTLVTPNSIFNIPDAQLDNVDYNKYLPRTEIINFFENYIDRHHLPVMYNTNVISVEPADDNGYIVKTTERNYKSNNVVIATGFFQHPKIPLAVDVPRHILQIHTSQYRNPQSLPDGAVLIIGSAQSGCQIAEELYQNGRKVFLSTGTAIRVPRRYRGKDIIEWLDLVGVLSLTPDQLPPGMSKFHGIPHLSGTNGGHTINLHKFVQDGVILLGHIRGIWGSNVSIAPDLHDNLLMIDQGELQIVNMIDDFIKANNIDVPDEELPQLKDGYDHPIIECLDLKDEGINTIIWAMGYTFDYGFVKVPVRDKDGFPVQNSGVTNYKGLYFVGLPWMPSERSGFLAGVGDAAGKIADRIVA